MAVLYIYIYILCTMTKTDGMPTNIWRLPSRVFFFFFCYYRQERKINAYGRRVDDVCLTYSSHRILHVCQQKKRNEG